MSVAYVAGLGRNRQRPQTAVAFRAAASGQTNGGTTVGVTIPGSAVAGDLAISFTVLQSPRTVTPPSGWLPITDWTVTQRGSLGSAPAVFVHYKTIAAGDIGAARTWTLSSASDAATDVVIYSNVGGISVQPVWHINDAVTAATYKARNPELKAGPYDRIVSAAAAHTAAAIGANAADPSAPPTGFTQRVNNKGGNGGLVKPRSITVADAPGTTNTSGTFWPFSQNCYHTMVSFALRPAIARTKDVEQLPSYLNTLPVFQYGASYGNYCSGVEPSGSNGSEHITDALYHERLKNAAGRNTASRNYSMGGSLIMDQAALMFGTATEKTEFAPDDAVHVNTRATTWWATAMSGLVVIDGLGNDGFYDASGESAKRRYGAAWGLEAMIRAVRSSAKVDYNNAAFTYTGTWTNLTSTGYMGGGAKQTTVPGDKVTYTASASHELVLVAQDDARTGGGAAFQINVDGAYYFAWTESNQMKTTGTRQDYGFGPMVIPIELAAGTPTIEVIHTGTSGQKLIVNGTMVRAATPPIVVVNLLPTLDETAVNTAYSGFFTFSNAAFAIYDQIARDAVAKFTDGRVIAYDPKESGRWDIPSMIGWDLVHINGEGHRHYAREIIDLLNAKVA